MTFLIGEQPGYAKFILLYLWEIQSGCRARRERLNASNTNIKVIKDIVSTQLVVRVNNIFPPLHIKFGQIKRLHFLYCNLDIIQEYYGVTGDLTGERFHQDINVISECYER